jgi:two-component sensor histidine kinase/PAS domain-containing protein
MSLFADLLLDRARLGEDVVEHLQALLSDWQIIADLSFADLLLWVPHELEDGTPAYLCVGQMRPYTAQTIYPEDLVGRAFPVLERPMVARALTDQRVIRDADPDWSTGVPVREEAIPVRFRDAVVAVVTREANVSTARSPSNLELTYLESAGELAQMLADGTFPYPADTYDERELSPRVGDGIMRVDELGRVTYASPNAISAYRRLGSLDHVVGQALGDFEPAAGELAEYLSQGRPLETEIELQGAVVLRRLLPLLREGAVTGGLLLVREVTELRRHERALRVKDATIREIHHRVKNNLQTVASLLRLQGRRLKSDEARDALAESVRRISSIALVHETLSQDSRQRVSFEKIARRIVDMLADGLVDPDAPVAFELDGNPGELPAEVATPLALILTELLQNCVEHAFVGRPRPDAAAPVGTVTIVFDRGVQTLRVLVCDDGVGLPEGTFESMANLGLQIARTLVESELGGTFEPVTKGEGAQGTAIELVLPLP